ncbi:MAG: hypothetical protein HQL96_13150 [Magnetococcales bacterium]|nr:hypothetical protein [Magnetococcales bacterium]
MGQITNECNPELVSAFLDDELDQIIVGMVARHLVQCDHCRKTMSRLAQVRDAVSEKFTWCDPEELTRSVMMAISNEKSHSPRDRVSRFGLSVLMLAALFAGPLSGSVDAGEYVEHGEFQEINQ